MNDYRRKEMNREEISNFVIETLKKDITLLSSIDINELSRYQTVLKRSAILSQQVLNMIKQQAVDIKQQELSVSTRTLELREERNKILIDYNDIQEKKMK